MTNLNTRIVKTVKLKTKKGKNTLEKIVCPNEFSFLFTFLAIIANNGARLESLHVALIGSTISKSIAVSKVTAGYSRIVKKVAKKSLKVTSFAELKICSTGIKPPIAS